MVAHRLSGAGPVHQRDWRGAARRRGRQDDARGTLAMQPHNTALNAVNPQDDVLLKVEDLKIGFPQGRGHLLRVIDSANLSLKSNASVGIVGESGSGKTMLCRALIGTLARHGAVITSGAILFEGRNIAGASENIWRHVRGRQIGYVPQSSLAGLNPVLTIGTQLIESLQVFRPTDRRAAE